MFKYRTDFSFVQLLGILPQQPIRSQYGLLAANPQPYRGIRGDRHCKNVLSRSKTLSGTLKFALQTTICNEIVSWALVVEVHQNNPQKYSAGRKTPYRKVPLDLIKLMLKCMEIPEKGLINQLQTVESTGNVMIDRNKVIFHSVFLNKVFFTAFTELVFFTAF